LGLIGRARISVPAFFLPHWSIFPKVHALVGFRNKFQNQRLSELVSDFIEASRNFIFNLATKKAAKYYENRQRP
jgi:hypothetical protein